MSACVALPATAAATPATTSHHAASHHAGSHHAGSHHAGSHHRVGGHATHHGETHHHRLRPMTSGERQYRNGCLQGYITDDCHQFTVPSLTTKGINPFL
jgi:hypothetical protein